MEWTFLRSSRFYNRVKYVRRCLVTVYDTICEILSEQLEIPLDEITAESKLRDDLSADSLDLIDLAMTLEDEFRKEVPDEALEKMKTVGDVVAFIEKE